MANYAMDVEEATHVCADCGGECECVGGCECKGCGCLVKCVACEEWCSVKGMDGGRCEDCNSKGAA